MREWEMKRINALWFCSVAAMIASPAWGQQAPGTAAADEGEASDASGMNDIIVTAQRRDQNRKLHRFSSLQLGRADRSDTACRGAGPDIRHRQDAIRRLGSGFSPQAG